MFIGMFSLSEADREAVRRGLEIACLWDAAHAELRQHLVQYMNRVFPDILDKISLDIHCLMETMTEHGIVVPDPSEFSESEVAELTRRYERSVLRMHSLMQEAREKGTPVVLYAPTLPLDILQSMHEPCEGSECPGDEWQQASRRALPEEAPFACLYAPYAGDLTRQAYELTDFTSFVSRMPAHERGKDMLYLFEEYRDARDAAQRVIQRGFDQLRTVGYMNPDAVSEDRFTQDRLEGQRTLILANNRIVAHLEDIAANMLELSRTEEIPDDRLVGAGAPAIGAPGPSGTPLTGTFARAMLRVSDCLQETIDRVWIVRHLVTGEPMPTGYEDPRQAEFMTPLRAIRHLREWREQAYAEFARRLPVFTT